MRSRRSGRRPAAWTAVMLGALALALAPAAAGAAAPPAQAGSCPWATSHAPIPERVSEVLSHMTLQQEIAMVEGHGSNNPYVFYMPPIPSLCIPQLGEEDGPNGVADKLTGVTQLPAGVALAATWDPQLAARYGRVIGAEERGKGAAVNLGPTVNIDRDPRWGRSFEAFTEDPFLNSALAVAEIRGVQSQGELSQVKHYDAYNQETNRNLPPDDAIVSQRTLHEIYMPAFEAAVKRAGVASLMCAYSAVNGAFSCDDADLLERVLRQEWGFTGFVTSDYGALHATTGAEQGTDQEQPESTYFGAPLEQAVIAGTIPRSDLNTMVSRMLDEMFRFGLFSAPPTGNVATPVTSPAHLAVATAVADTGTTLLKNVRGTLPLAQAAAGTVAVIGPAASTSPTYGGGGSAAVIPSAPVSPLQGIEAAAGAGTHVVYSPGLPADDSLPRIPRSVLTPAYAPTAAGGSWTGTLTAPETGTYVLAIDNPCGCYAPTYLSVDGHVLIDDPGTPPVSVYSAAVSFTAGQRYTLSITGGPGSGGNPGGVSSSLTWATPAALAPGIAQAVTAARSAASAVVVVADDTESEAADRPGLNLPSAQDELVSAVTAANPHTTVVLDAGAPIAMPWLSAAGAVLDAWYPGEANGTSLAHVLFGSVDPSGHLPVTFPAALSQVPASQPQRFPGTDNLVQYSEGLDVGYRWYDARNIRPLFPFGFGLSYTRFAYGGLRVGRPSPDGAVTVSAIVRNIGRRAGSDVAQLYLADPRHAGEPPRQLVGFRRVTLAPGGTRRVSFTITPRDRSIWDQATGGWTEVRGTYGVYVGDSSALGNLPLRGSFRIATTPGARRLSLRAPAAMRPGSAQTVTVSLGPGGNALLRSVRFSLQAPEGFKVRVLGSSERRRVHPGRSASVRFRVSAPSWAPAETVTLHAAAQVDGYTLRETGASVAIG